MWFVAPIWLLGLVPWAVLAAWLFLSRRRRVHVPFVRLWRGPAMPARARRGFELPPVPVLLALLALFAAVFAMARPAVEHGGGASEPGVTLVVDRGLTMSARGISDLRYRESFADVAEALRARFGSLQVEVIAVPGDATPWQGSLEQALQRIKGLAPTAMDSRAALNAILEQRRAARSAPMIVISDCPLQTGAALHVSPETGVRDVGITTLAARERPSPQVMVRVRNESDLSTADLVISSDGPPLEQHMDLPDLHRERDYFVSLPRIGSVVSAELRVSDDLPADDRAWLAREGSSPRIEPRATLPQELRRVIDVYRRERPDTEGSARLAVVTDRAQLPADAPAIVAAPADGPGVSGAVEVRPHPVTDHVNWTGLPQPLRLAGNAPDGWLPIVSIDGHPVVSVSPQPPNRLWMGFDAREWARTLDYVIFWTNAFDWAGGGGEVLAGHPLAARTPEWQPVQPTGDAPGLQPGLYRRSDGAIRAFNASAEAVAQRSRGTGNWRRALSTLTPRRGFAEWTDGLLVAAVASLLLAVLSWRRAPEAAQAPGLAQVARSRASA